MGLIFIATFLLVLVGTASQPTAPTSNGTTVNATSSPTSVSPSFLSSASPSFGPSQTPSNAPTQKASTTPECIDDPLGKVKEVGILDCPGIVSFAQATGYGCEDDLAYVDPTNRAPEGSIIRELCPFTCDYCGGGENETVLPDEPKRPPIQGCENNPSEGPGSRTSDISNYGEPGDIGALRGIPGACVEYPADDSVPYKPDGLCSPYGVRGRVFVTLNAADFEGGGLPTDQDLLRELRSALDLLSVIFQVAETSFLSLGSNYCFDLQLKWFCWLTFPPCTNITTGQGNVTVEAPQMICREPACEKLQGTCEASYAWIRQNLPEYTTRSLVVPCDATISNKTEFYEDDLVKSYDEWPAVVGTPCVCDEEKSWPLDGYDVTVVVNATEEEIKVPCYELELGEAEQCDLDTYDRCPVNALVPIFKPGSSVECTCGMICPLPVWDAQDTAVNEARWRALFAMYTVPAFLSVPFNVILAVNQWTARSRRSAEDGKRFNVPLLFLAAVLAIAFVALGPLASAFLRFDMICNGEPGLAISSTDGLTLDRVIVVESTTCLVTKAAPHVLQAFTATIAVFLYRLYLKLRASMMMRRFDGGGRGDFAFSFVAIFVVPFCCLIIMYTLNVDPSSVDSTYANAMADTVRNQFVCHARFPEVWQEILFVHLPLLIYATAALIVSLFLVQMVREMAKVHGTKTRKSRKNSVQTWWMTVGHWIGVKRKTTESVRLPSTKVDATTAKLIIAMRRFAIASSCSLILSTASTLGYLPQAASFSENIADWVDCTTTGGLAKCSREALEDPCDYREDYRDDGITYRPFDQAWCLTDVIDSTKDPASCTQISDFAPSFVLMMFAFGAPSMLPLIFGFLFAWAHLKKAIATMQKSVGGGFPKLGYAPSSSSKEGASTTVKSSDDESSSKDDSATSTIVSLQLSPMVKKPVLSTAVSVDVNKEPLVLPSTKRWGSKGRKSSRAPHETKR